MSHLPASIRVTHAAWCEKSCAWKIQLGNENATIGYVFWPAGFGDDRGYQEALQIAQRICEGWNT